MAHRIKDIRTAFEIYQPTAIKGKILKSFFLAFVDFRLFIRDYISKEKIEIAAGD